MGSALTGKAIVATETTPPKALTEAQAVRLLRETHPFIKSVKEASANYRAESVFTDELLEALAQPTPTIPFRLSDVIEVVNQQLINIEDAAKALDKIGNPLGTFAESVEETVTQAINENRQLGNALIVDVKAETYRGTLWPYMKVKMRAVIPLGTTYRESFEDWIEQEGLQWQRAESRRVHIPKEDWHEHRERDRFIYQTVRFQWEADEAAEGKEPGFPGGKLDSFNEAYSLYDETRVEIADTLFNLGLRESAVSDDRAGLYHLFRYVIYKGVWEHAYPEDESEGKGWVMHGHSGFAEKELSGNDLNKAVDLMDNPGPWIVEVEFELDVYP